MIYIFLFILLIGYLLYKSYKNTQDIQINHIKIASTTNKNSRTKLSILHLSDLHLEKISLSPEGLEKKLSNHRVDLIALTGDFMDRKRSIPKLIPYLHVLNRIQPKYGIYAVFGNHDYVLKEQDLNQLHDLLLHYHCHVLQNTSKTIDVNGRTINLIGIDDFGTKRSNLPLAYEHVEEGTNIVLTHDPNVVLEMENYPFDYLMAGHFHGGQICYPKPYHLVKMGKLARNRVIKGLHTQYSSPFYISEGLGQTGINIRVGSRPEITFHELII